MAFLAVLSGHDAVADAAVLGSCGTPGAKPRDAPADVALDHGVLGTRPGRDAPTDAAPDDSVATLSSYVQYGA